jgi:hypothetical protein
MEDKDIVGLLGSFKNKTQGKPLEIVFGSIMFGVLFAIMVLLSLVSVDAQGIHITVENIGVKSFMSAVYSILAVAMAYSMRITARGKYDNLESTIALNAKLDEYSNIDRIKAQKKLEELQKAEYKELRKQALETIRLYVKDYEPKPSYHYNRKYSKDINKLIRVYYKIKMPKDTIYDILNPLRVDDEQLGGMCSMPDSRSVRDKKWLKRKSLIKAAQMFVIVGLAGEIVTTLIMTGEILGTLIRLAVVVGNCLYTYIREYNTCNIKDTARINRSLTLLKHIQDSIDKPIEKADEQDIKEA